MRAACLFVLCCCVGIRASYINNYGLEIFPCDNVSTCEGYPQCSLKTYSNLYCRFNSVFDDQFEESLPRWCYYTYIYEGLGTSEYACSGVTCPPGQFEISSICYECTSGYFCLGGFHRKRICSTCQANEYQVQGCTSTQDRKCCKHSCSSNEYLNCTCNPCNTCNVDQYLSTPCSNLTGGGTCGSCPSEHYCNRTHAVRCAQCGSGSYETKACTNTTNRECSACRTCAHNSNETSPCTNRTDRQCSTPPDHTYDGKTFYPCENVSYCSTLPQCFEKTYAPLSCVTSTAGMDAYFNVKYPGWCYHTTGAGSSVPCNNFSCPAGKHAYEFACAACTTNGPNKYCLGGYSKPQSCTTCAIDEVEIHPCNSTHDRRCCPVMCPLGSVLQDCKCQPCPVNSFCNGTAVAPCSVCPPGRFQLSACTNASNSVCAPCLAEHYCLGGTHIDTCRLNCTPGAFENQSCSALTNRVCSSCANERFCADGKVSMPCKQPCEPGWYEKTPCTDRTDRSCQPCANDSYCLLGTQTRCTDPCVPDYYENQTCTNVTDRHCALCPSNHVCANTSMPVSCGSFCGPGFYEETPCTFFRNRTCLPCSNTSFCLGGNMKQQVCTKCTNQEYSLRNCSRAEDAICCPVSPCEDGTYMTQACALNQSRNCSNCPSRMFCFGNRAYNCKVCSLGFFAQVQCSKFQDTVCQRCPYLPSNATFVDEFCTWVCDEPLVPINNKCLQRIITKSEYINRTDIDDVENLQAFGLSITLFGALAIIGISMALNLYCCKSFKYQPVSQS